MYAKSRVHYLQKTLLALCHTLNLSSHGIGVSASLPVCVSVSVHLCVCACASVLVCAVSLSVFLLLCCRLQRDWWRGLRTDSTTVFLMLDGAAEEVLQFLDSASETLRHCPLFVLIRPVADQKPSLGSLKVSGHFLSTTAASSLFLCLTFSTSSKYVALPSDRNTGGGPCNKCLICSADRTGLFRH